jgi:exo-1,4-beta-D-glucosaminidase
MIKKIMILLIALSSILYSQKNLDYSISLKENWKIQSSDKISSSGDKISSNNFETSNWYTTNIPSTVLAALVKNKVYTNIFVGENLKQIPHEQFQKSWWYRNEFELKKNNFINTTKIKFNGINNRANIWLNGNLIADTSIVFGAFRQFEFDVTKYVNLNDKNVLAIEVFPPIDGDYTIGFVDWNPAPPDKNMGIWREVIIEQSGNVSINFPFVKTQFANNDLSSATLTISTELKNNSSRKISGILEGKIGSINFSQIIELNPNENRLISFSPNEFSQLVIKNPKVWWTHDLGEQFLYDLQLEFKSDNSVSDLKKVKFGIREVTDYFNENGHRGYKLNGKKILIRGGGWVDNLLLDNTYENLVTQVQYAKHMNLNTLRFEGFWGSTEDIYNLCDENGILLMVGISCHWEWESYIGKKTDNYGSINSKADIIHVSALWKDQIKWLRNHPSIFVWLYGSDKYPRPEMEREYLKILKDEDPLRPFLASAAFKKSLVGSSGVKMKGPYDYVPPVYWYTDTANGGAYGFNTETSPGPEVPIIESIKKFIPQDHLWPIDSVWNFHCAGHSFHSLERYNDAMNQRLGKANDLEEYCTKAQFLNYEGMRAMFEAFVANRYNATGIIQWMYNSAWPKFWWQFYDYYLVPNAAFYAAKKACEPIHIFYNYGDTSVCVTNNSVNDLDSLKAQINIYSFDLKNKIPLIENLNLKADEIYKMSLRKFSKEIDSTYFLDLRLFSKNGEMVSSNFYTLSKKPIILDYEHNEWYVTPTKQYDDLTKLNQLPKTNIELTAKYFNEDGKTKIITQIENPSNSIAYQIELNLFDENNDEAIVPIFWDDNYITLLPNEKRELSCYFNSNISDAIYLKVKGWNITEKTIKIKLHR